MMQIGESFEIFKQQYGISQNLVETAFQAPNQTQKLNDEITFYLKKFDNTQKQNLFLATQKVNGDTIFSFAYWVPDEIIPDYQIQLIDILEVFANNLA